MLPTATFAYTFLVATGVWLGAALLFFELERGHNENVHEIGDALWWSMTTLSTVGYGDLYPVTTGGRVVAVILMVVGVRCVMARSRRHDRDGFLRVPRTGLFSFGRLRMRHHLLLLGWNDRSSIVVSRVNWDPATPGSVIVLRRPRRSPIGISFVRRMPSRAEISNAQGPRQRPQR
ncbi:MAG: two pore domain potassium channel family protein [Sandaracinus sp.]|nr:two pore domain potassium channel family protein [Sandaracinus sp.]